MISMLNVVDHPIFLEKKLSPEILSNQEFDACEGTGPQAWNGLLQILVLMAGWLRGKPKDHDQGHSHSCLSPLKNSKELPVRGVN
jgi:hypothetical protein